MLFPFDNSYARLTEAFFEPVEPSPVSAPSLIRLNEALAAELGGDGELLAAPEGLAILAGNSVADGSQPIAMAYSGHQFGGFSPSLGDGRAVLLGEVVGLDSIRRDIQLKGSGPTPFSRRGDGRSALGPVLREYIVSEAMAAMGVPTTRALAAVATGEHVYREGPTPGGVFTRVAQSHLRIGTFQWFAARHDDANLKVLADYAIARHYPDAAEAENPYGAFLEGVIKRQAELVAHWMQFGFIHGVMNTDNMTISGETIDYGPCAFMDTYHPAKRFSSIDHQGRYAFANQSPIAFWNLTRLAETLLPLIDEDEKRAIAKAETALGTFADLHASAFKNRFLAKIGIAQEKTEETTEDDGQDWTLVEKLLDVMAEQEADFTLTFRRLSTALETGDDGPVISLFKDPQTITAWLATWKARITDPARPAAIALMKQTNPIFIPRNHRVEEAIEAGYQGDFSPFHRLVDLLARPFEEQPEFADYENAPKPDEVVQATFCGT